MKFKILLGSALLASSFFASAEVDRMGVFTTFGLGTNLGAKIGVSVDDVDFSADATGIISTQVKLGYGINSQTLVSIDYDIGLIVDNEVESIFTTNSYTIAGTYFIQEVTASPYVLAGVGFTSAKVTDVSSGFESDPITGLSLKIGGGYQFFDHFQIEAAYLTSKLKDSDFEDVSMSLPSIQIKLQYVSYSY
ncbi:MAG: outer membrane beta-barrel protein [Saccharospirillaceae bacterium]|nr:porin family protein [Pseudomonadales bacterium]NRB77422.1 outer membrane beta-barrel protein [Saccharospirillaceae bacterium]